MTNPDDRHAVTVLLAVGNTGETVTVVLDCEVCGHQRLHCALQHLPLLRRVLADAGGLADQLIGRQQIGFE